MSESTVRYTQTYSAASVNPQRNVHGGSSVFIKVLENKGNNTYSVSINGRKFDVKSNIHLNEGQSFKARVKITGDQKIQLVMKDSVLPVENLELKVFSQDGEISKEYAAYLQQLSLVPDEATVKIMQFLQQSGLKIDLPLIKKAERIALKFPGKEKKAAEIAVMLLEENIEADEETVRKTISMLEDSGSNENSGNHSQNPGNQNQNTENQNQNTENQNPEQTEKCMLEKLYADFSEKSPDLLAVINNQRMKNKSWLILPYEFKTKDNEYKGIIRILSDLNEKQIEKIVINANNFVQNFYFVLQYKLSEIEEVRFCTLPPLLPSEQKKEELRLGGFINSGMNLRNPVAVTYSDSAFISGICSSDTPPVFFREEI